MAGKFYAVKAGRQVGIFNDPWDKVKTLVERYPGAIYKGFTTYEEASKYFYGGIDVALEQLSLAETTVPRPVLPEVTLSRPILFEVTPARPTTTEGLVVYTDGSCIDKRGGYAAVAVRPDGTHTCYSGRVPINPCTNQKAELYAILMALRSVDAPTFTLYTDSKYSIGCCTTWLETWKRQGWSRPVENRSLIEQIDAVRGGRKIRFEYVKAHCGIEFNELCDQLAKAGTEQ